MQGTFQRYCERKRDYNYDDSCLLELQNNVRPVTSFSRDRSRFISSKKV